MDQFHRITVDPNVMGGRACIRGMRITVASIVSLISNGMTVAEILEEYPSLQEKDIRQSLQYAAWLADEALQAPQRTAARGPAWIDSPDRYRTEPGKASKAPPQGNVM